MCYTFTSTWPFAFMTLIELVNAIFSGIKTYSTELKCKTPHMCWQRKLIISWKQSTSTVRQQIKYLNFRKVKWKANYVRHLSHAGHIEQQEWHINLISQYIRCRTNKKLKVLKISLNHGRQSATVFKTQKHLVLITNNCFYPPASLIFNIYRNLTWHSTYSIFRDHSRLLDSTNFFNAIILYLHVYSSNVFMPWTLYSIVLLQCLCLLGIIQIPRLHEVSIRKFALQLVSPWKSRCWGTKTCVGHVIDSM